MTLPTFPGGRTLRGARATIAYLLDDRVVTGEAIVMRGNPKMTLDFIEQVSKNKWCWSSGALSFEEIIDDDILEEIIDDFYKTFFPGLDEDQFDCLIVKHTDKGRSELHYIAPRMELGTGLAYNPYFVKKDFVKKDLFQQFINTKYGLSNPLDPSRKKATPSKSKIWSKTKKPFLAEIDAKMKPFIEKGTVSNRKEVIEKLREWGIELGENPTKKKYITVINPVTEKPHRLKGKYYTPDFQGIDKIQEQLEADATAQGFGRPLEEIEKDLQRFIDRDAKFNHKRYKKKELKNADRTRTDYPTKQSKAFGKRRGYQLALRVTTNRIGSYQQLDRQLSDSSSEVAATATTASQTDSRQQTDQQRELDTLIEDAERINRQSENLDKLSDNFTESTYRAIAAERRSAAARHRVDESIIDVIKSTFEEIGRYIQSIGESIRKIGEVEEYQQPEIESTLDDSVAPGEFVPGTFNHS